jgi:hypothetical protein
VFKPVSTSENCQSLTYSSIVPFPSQQLYSVSRIWTSVTVLSNQLTLLQKRNVSLSICCWAISAALSSSKQRWPTVTCWPGALPGVFYLQGLFHCCHDIPGCSAWACCLRFTIWCSDENHTTVLKLLLTVGRPWWCRQYVPPKQG